MSENCLTCNVKHTLFNFFYYCIKVQAFWDSFVQWWKTIYSFNIILSGKYIIFGYYENMMLVKHLFFVYWLEKVYCENEMTENKNIFSWLLKKACFNIPTLMYLKMNKIYMYILLMHQLALAVVWGLVNILKLYICNYHFLGFPSRQEERCANNKWCENCFKDGRCGRNACNIWSYGLVCFVSI